MEQKKEFEIVRHTTMKHLEIFLVEMTSRSPHGHDDLEIGILLEGSLLLFTEQEQHRLRPGDIYVITRYQVHSFHGTGEKNLILAFQIKTDFYRKINHQLGFLSLQSNIIRSGSLHNTLHRILLDCADVYFSARPFNDVRCSALLLDAMYEILSATHFSFSNEKESDAAKKISRRLNRIMDYIAEHYSEHIALDDIAALEHVSACHISHFIKNILGISFQDYLNQVRFEQALRLADTSDLSILDICLETGFSSSRYLNQMFLKNLGCTVKEYKKMPEKPPFILAALPTDSVQKRYSFEQSAFLFRKYR